MSTALQRALAGSAVKGKAAEGGLKQAVGAIERLKAAGAKARESGAVYGQMVVTELEASGAALAAGAAAGRYGDKLQIYGYDGRAIPAVLGLFLGAYGRANKRKWGSHAYAIGAGTAHATIADAGRRWGERMRAKAEGPEGTLVPVAPSAPAVAGAIGSDELEKYLREITLANSTPDAVRANLR